MEAVPAATYSEELLGPSRAWDHLWRNDRDRALRADQPPRRPLSHLLDVPLVRSVEVRLL